jgi:hypothetical protein
MINTPMRREKSKTNSLIRYLNMNATPPPISNPIMHNPARKAIAYGKCVIDLIVSTNASKPNNLPIPEAIKRIPSTEVIANILLK